VLGSYPPASGNQPKLEAEQPQRKQRHPEVRHGGEKCRQWTQRAVDPAAGPANHISHQPTSYLGQLV